MKFSTFSADDVNLSKLKSQKDQNQGVFNSNDKHKSFNDMNSDFEI